MDVSEGREEAWLDKGEMEHDGVVDMEMGSGLWRWGVGS